MTLQHPARGIRAMGRRDSRSPSARSGDEAGPLAALRALASALAAAETPDELGRELVARARRTLGLPSLRLRWSAPAAADAGGPDLVLTSPTQRVAGRLRVPVRATGRVVAAIEIPGEVHPPARVELVGLLADLLGRELALRAKGAADAERGPRFSDVAAALPAMVFDLERAPDGSIRFPSVSVGCRDLLGIEGDALEADGSRFLAALAPEDRDAFVASLEASARDRSPWSWEACVEVAFERRWLRGSARIVERADGSAEGPGDGSVLWRGLVMDVTAHRQAVERARALEAELGRAARRCTIGDLASNVVHELSQPLGALASYAAGVHDLALAGTRDPESVAHAARKVRELALRAGGVLQRFKRLVRHAEPRRCGADPVRLVEGVAGILRDEARRAGLVVRFEIEPRLPAVRVDPVQIQGVVLTLARRSFAALREVAAPSAIVVRAGFDDAGRPEISVAARVAPDVPGDPFAAASHAAGVADDPSLQLAASIVEAHGGRLRSERRPDGFAIVRFPLPTLPEGGPE